MSQVRDSSLLDAIEALDPIAFSGTVWRVVREGRDPLLASRSGGRWDDGTFDVLYASAERAGAIAEAEFYLNRGQPVAPSKPRYELYELKFRLNRALRLVNLAAIDALGVNVAQYGATHYAQRNAEYPRTQEIGEVANFLGFDGLMVPSARHDCLNVILFDESCEEGGKTVIANHGRVTLL